MFTKDQYRIKMLFKHRMDLIFQRKETVDHFSLSTAYGEHVAKSFLPKKERNERKKKNVWPFSPDIEINQK